MKRIKAIFFVFSLILLGCEKDQVEGPNLNDIFGELDIIQTLSVVGDSADFAGGENMFFNAKFSKQVDWSIRIKGQSSSSIKIISGKSNFIDQSNSLWRGESSKLPFFISENCSVELTFENHEDIIQTSLMIKNPKNYNNENTILVTDFEAGFNPNFTGFFQAGCTKSLTIGGSGEGSNYLQQFGTCDWDWLIGYIDYYQNFWLNQNTIINDPSQVYFNIMVKGDSTISIVDGVPNSLFKLEFYEDENGDGYYDSSSEDRYDYEFDVDWNGWKMVSICYNDIDNLIPAVNNSGDGIRNPNKIYNVRTLLLANPNSGFAKADVDFLIWSIGGPILN